MLRARNLTILLAVVAVTVGTAHATINKTIRVGPDETRRGNLSSVNGTVDIGAGATVTGKCSTVNGTVQIGERAKVDGASTVNGRLEIGQNAFVDGDAETVNGSVETDDGATVTGDVTTVNGSIELLGTRVGGDVRTVNGSIELRKSSTVQGDIRIEGKWRSNTNRNRPIRIEVIGGSVVEGNVIVENPDTPVEVILRDGGKVMGRIEGANVIER